MSTPIQAAVSEALRELGFVYQDTGIPGAAHQFKVTEETLEHLKGLVDKTIEVDSSGTVAVE